MRVGRLSARHSDVHAFRLKPLDLEDHSAPLVRFGTMRPALAHKTVRRDSSLVQGSGNDLQIAAGCPLGKGSCGSGRLLHKSRSSENA
jgi:hypothetical protein